MPWYRKTPTTQLALLFLKASSHNLKGPGLLVLFVCVCGCFVFCVLFLFFTINKPNSGDSQELCMWKTFKFKSYFPLLVTT